jgi:hypothetical protein
MKIPLVPLLIKGDISRPLFVESLPGLPEARPGSRWLVSAREGQGRFLILNLLIK